MDATTIAQLNQLNQTFYQQVSTEFDSSRQYYWEGWQQLKPYISEMLQQDYPQVVDLGCGNGRFGQFLNETCNGAPFRYLGLDSSSPLLLLAAENRQPHQQFQRFDLLPFLQGQKLFPASNIDLLVVFGVTHHIPGSNLRQQLLSKLEAVLKTNGILIISFWQFAEEERYQKKLTDPSVVGLDPSQLEPHDYILDWQRNTAAYRYCHYWDESEITAAGRTSDLELVQSFRADSKSGTANRYLIFKKTA